MNNIIITIVQRTLILPFFSCIIFIAYIFSFFKQIINFLIYGGEVITYTKKNNRKTIQDIYNKIVDDNKHNWK